MSIGLIGKKLGMTREFFDTGISIHVSDGYYVEIVPRSSITKTDFLLANSVGIIDPEGILKGSKRTDRKTKTANNINEIDFTSFLI